MKLQNKAHMLFLVFVGGFVLFMLFAIKTGKESTISQYKEQYSAWTNYTKRTDISFAEFIQLRDIGVLR